jgi:predicted DNA-binding transcriptional regulator AlpA
MSEKTMATEHRPECLIDTNEVAKRYGIHPKTLLRFVKEGKVPPPIKTTIGNGLKWRESVIENHLRDLE